MRRLLGVEVRENAERKFILKLLKENVDRVLMRRD